MELKLPIERLGSEFIVQKYKVGFEFKPHIDDVLSNDKKTMNEKDTIRFYYNLVKNLNIVVVNFG